VSTAFVRIAHAAPKSLRAATSVALLGLRDAEFLFSHVRLNDIAIAVSG
jgi:hypothetical protein